MSRPYIKFYLQKNPNFGKPKPIFIAPTLEDYEKYLQEDHGGIYPGHKAIRPYEEYVKRKKQVTEEPHSEFLISSIAVKNENSDVIKEVESTPYFIRWLMPHQKELKDAYN